MTEEEKQIIRDSCCITDEQRKEWNKKIVEDSLAINEEERKTLLNYYQKLGE